MRKAIRFYALFARADFTIFAKGKADDVSVHEDSHKPRCYPRWRD